MRASLKNLARLSLAAAALHGCNLSDERASIGKGTVGEEKLADTSVATAKIKDSAVTTGKIADASVTTAKLADGAVTTAKLGTIDVNAFTNYVRDGGNPSALTVGTTGASALTLSTSNTARLTIASGGGATFSGTLAVTGGSTFTGASTFSSTISGSDSVLVQKYANDASTFLGTWRQFPTTTANGTTGSQALGGYIFPKVLAGITDLGSASGVAAFSMRNHSSDTATADNGTLTNMYGLLATYGHWNTDGAATPLTTNAFGVYVGPYYRTGTIAAMYDIYLAADTGGGTATTKYGIRQANTSMNRLDGNLGIGLNPSVPLHVSGNATITGATITLSGVADNGGAGSYLCIDVAGAGIVSKNGAATCLASDRRMKENIEPMANVLPKILQLRGVTFNWKEKSRGTDRSLGLIAQEVQPLFPEAVQMNSRGFLSVNYEGMVGAVIAAVQELHAKWSADHVLLGQLREELKKENVALKTENARLQAENARIQERLEKIERALAGLPESKDKGRPRLSSLGAGK